MKKSALILLFVGGLTACSSLPQLASKPNDPLTAQEHATLGDSYQAKGEKDLAVQQYQTALVKDPKYLPALMALGTISFGDQDWKNAEIYFQRAVKVSPHNPAAVNNLAMVYLAKDTNLDKAREALDTAIPTSGALAPYLLDTLANLAIREGRWTDAEQALEKAQGMADPHNADLNAHLQQTRDKLSAAVKTKLTPTH